MVLLLVLIGVDLVLRCFLLFIIGWILDITLKLIKILGFYNFSLILVFSVHVRLNQTDVTINYYIDLLFISTLLP